MWITDVSETLHPVIRYTQTNFKDLKDGRTDVPTCTHGSNPHTHAQSSIPLRRLIYSVWHETIRHSKCL